MIEPCEKDGEVFAYVGGIQNLKDLHEQTYHPFKTAPTSPVNYAETCVSDFLLLLRLQAPVTQAATAECVADENESANLVSAVQSWTTESGWRVGLVFSFLTHKLAHFDSS